MYEPLAAGAARVVEQLAWRHAPQYTTRASLAEDRPGARQFVPFAMLSYGTLVPLLTMILLQAGCTHEQRIHQYGAMREVMREGKSEPRIGLRALALPGVYGVGAMAGLDGEVTIDDGRAWVTRVIDGQPHTTGPSPAEADQATLLTVGRPARWSEHHLEGVLDAQGMTDAIKRLGAGRSMRTDEPLLFTIDTTDATASVHVIAGVCLHANPEAPGLRMSLSPGTPVRFVGVYAEGREGELTHHGTRVHVHAVFEHEGRTITAHVDDFRLGAGGVLRIGV